MFVAPATSVETTQVPVSQFSIVLGGKKQTLFTASSSSVDRIAGESRASPVY